MICSVCAIGLHYLILKFLSVNLFLWGHELANSFLLFSVHKSFLQIIKNLTRSKQQERKRAEKETPLGTTPRGTQM